MISIEKSFKTSDGELFISIEAAQLHELEKFLDGKIPEPKKVAMDLLKEKTHIVDLLTMKVSSHPKARRANGATRKPRQTALIASPSAASK